MDIGPFLSHKYCNYIYFLRRFPSRRLFASFSVHKIESVSVEGKRFLFFIQLSLTFSFNPFLFQIINDKHKVSERTFFCLLNTFRILLANEEQRLKQRIVNHGMTLLHVSLYHYETIKRSFFAFWWI